MDLLQQLLQDNEKWLMERILSYAKLHNFTKYTSTLLEAWHMSILGLTNSLCMSIRFGVKEPQFTPDENYISDPVTEFGRLEAKRHHERGISMSMFLGLLKYYRDTYIDLIIEKGPQEFKQPWTHFILRSFDRFEIALCTEWITTDNSEHISRLEKANRRLSNEKNKYLTVFESTPRPVFLVDEDGLLDSMNLSAAHFLGLGGDSGEMYYSEGHSTIDRKAKGLRKPFESYLPWLKEDASLFSKGDDLSNRLEIRTDSNGVNQYFDVFFARMLDVSGKFSGMLIILDDITTRKQLELQLNHLATTDALTGANNLHRFLERAEEEIIRSERHDKPVSFLMLDIDHFKNINDTYGHAIGDDVLRVLSAACRKLFRKSDVFGRVGGEEFAAILPETTLEAATQVAERLRQILAQLEVDGPNGNISFTVSIGIVERKNGQNLSDVMRFADKSLYEAKNSGRNKVVAGNVKA
ncbi:diguanylate cyclase with PAS/PAC sensor [Solidesulfovibrio fructosivorans JJ]]|uniref:diguanylate cyclase n=1 Tax=Solidesulfovibrio fructosivorans JJ] TaxID=596151 RepID=E1JT87_SOLFR|nr:sensor domain-containing diguanylate cyclase [Solidesulfovibrio fructosivorans]EFL52347.1 diguanylate cyclase with PAS/PAC sensor [Solidesulfovibrio fructosivorans JJ]]